LLERTTYHSPIKIPYNVHLINDEMKLSSSGEYHPEEGDPEYRRKRLVVIHVGHL
jgi:hypothetical protein